MTRRRQRQEAEQSNRLTALTAKQQEYLKAISRSEMTVAIGPAGTGKTYPAALKGLELVQNTLTPYNTLVICRPAVAGAGENHGFLPGNIRRKIEPWLMALLDVLGSKADALIESGMVKAVPFQFMRGITLKDCVVIADEMQNSTPEQMKLFLTRLGSNCKAIVCGDISNGQRDIRQTVSGLDVLLNLIEISPAIKSKVSLIQYDKQDIVRSGLCQDFVEAFELHEETLYTG